MRKKSLSGLFIVFISALFLASCGSGDSGTASGSKITGYVEDPGITKARVTLYGKDGNSTGRMTVTDATGYFELRMPESMNQEEFSLVVSGGVDSGTGVDFTGIEMRCSLSLFNGIGGVVVSPVVTLLSGTLASGASIDEAKEMVALSLGLASDVDVTARPTENTELLKSSMLLTKIAMELKKSGKADPFSDVLSGIKGKKLIDGEDIADDVLDAIISDEALRNEIKAVYAVLKNSTDFADIVENFKKEEFKKAFAKEVAVRLELSDVEKANADYKRNIGLLTEKIYQAAGDSVIPLGGGIPSRIAKYVIFFYELDKADTLQSDGTAFSANLTVGSGDDAVKLESDDKIRIIASSTVLCDVLVPLYGDELPGNDNLKRLKYYYNSNASNFYFAEQLLDEMRDDEINDSIMTQIVKGKSAVGLFDEALQIIENQIVQSEFRGTAYRLYGNNLIKYNKKADAVAALEKAETIFRAVIKAKGEANIGSSDTSNLQGIASSYLNAGRNDKSVAVLDYLAYTVAPQLPTSNSYGRAVVGLWKVVDEYIGSGKTEEAKDVAIKLFEVAKLTPANIYKGKKYYKTRIFNLSRTAERFAILGEKEKVLEVYNEVKRLRSDDEDPDTDDTATFAETVSYMSNITRDLYIAGYADLANEAADGIPATVVNARGQTRDCRLYQSKAAKLVGVYKGVNGSIDDAVSYLDDRLNQVYSGESDRENRIKKDKIEALTYFNRNMPYIAQMLINKGDKVKAKTAVDMASGLIDGFSPDEELYSRFSYKINSGYSRTVDLYVQLGENDLALAETVKAAAIADGIENTKVRAMNRTDIALMYFKLGNMTRVNENLDDASDLIDADDSIWPKDKCSLYYSIIDICQDEMNRPKLARPYIDFHKASAEKIYDEGGTEKNKLYEVRELVNTASYYIKSGFYDDAKTVIDQSKTLILSLANNTEKVHRLIGYKTSVKGIAEYYARAGYFNEAVSVLSHVTTLSDINFGKLNIAKFYCTGDAFKDTLVASVDTDGDGRPDFFNPISTPEDIATSGLVPDDDCDGDGKADVFDVRPLFAD